MRLSDQGTLDKKTMHQNTKGTCEENKRRLLKLHCATHANIERNKHSMLILRGITCREIMEIGRVYDRFSS